MELIMPFVACASQEGPYEDQAFVAGYQSGQINQVLTVGAAIGARSFTFTIYTPLAKQMDLIGMRHGYDTATTILDGYEMWSTVTFTRSVS